MSRAWIALLLGWGLLSCVAPAPRPAPAEPPPPAPAAEPETWLLVRGGRVMTAAGPTLERADVLVRGERIEAVGTDLEAPAGARVIEAEGRWVTPGLIDPHSHIGVYPQPNLRANADGNESSDPFTPEVRAEDAFWPQDPAIERALAGGVTTILVLPGSANLVGGQGVALRLVPALSAAGMRVDGAPTSLKMACGENPKRVHGERSRPKTRMGSLAMLREELADAQGYTPPKDAPPDPARAALAAALRGEFLIQHHCYRADEMLGRIALFEQFDARPRAFHHAVEAYKIAPQLAAAGVAAVVWADWRGVKLELEDAVPAGAALLHVQGVRVALHSDSPEDIQRMNQQAARALAAGLRAGLELDADDAIRWITANPAWVLGVESRLGTLEPGKDADLTIWSGDPFSVYTRAERVFIRGTEVYARSAEPEPPRSDFELGRELF